LWDEAGLPTILCYAGVAVRHEEVVRSNQHPEMRTHRGTTQVNDDRFFEQALQEVRSQKVVLALWARALSDVDGDKAKTVAGYIKRKRSTIPILT